MTKKETVRYFILWLGSIAVILMFTIPHIMSARSEMNMTTVIRGYDNAVTRLTEGELRSMKSAADAYNRKIFQEQKVTPFRYRGTENDNNAEYQSMLRAENGIDTMCSLSIPKIELNLPVAHGTNSKKLYYELGHMYGTSLPWGGENTHCVIAGHSGLKSADLFTNLEKLKTGDKFYIYVLDEIHEYTVDRIKVVLPSEESEYLQTEAGEDYCTLYTCTPVGVNDHRLLVRGTRTNTEYVDNKTDAGTSLSHNPIAMAALKKLILWLLPSVTVFLYGLLKYLKIRTKSAQSQEAQK